MILILSGQGDFSTDIVIDWLEYLNHPFTRINVEDFLDNQLEICISTDKRTEIKIGGNSLCLDNIHAIWYRKFGFFNKTTWYENLMAHQNTGYESSRMSIQLQRLTNFLILHLRNKNWLPYPLCLPLNKLYVLEIAQHLGFTIPKTMVINRKSSIKDSDSYITKSLYDPTLSIMPNGNRFLNYTNRITPENNDCIPSSFFPSLIQEHIEKEYEIRTFFINGKLFSMGIFSQNDDRTKIDFRRYNISKPSRFTPITTPVEISDKIPMLMDKLNLNTGSLDFIKGKDSKYYFLEINPTGQFGMIDGACNYGLHKLVAEELIAMDYEK